MWVDVRDPLITLNAEREHRLSQESALMARMINARFKTRRESFLVRLPEQHCQNAEQKTWRTPTKTAGSIVKKHKDHVLGVERKVCAVLQNQDGQILVMGVTEPLEEVNFTPVL